MGEGFLTTSMSEVFLRLGESVLTGNAAFRERDPKRIVIQSGHAGTQAKRQPTGSIKTAGEFDLHVPFAFARPERQAGKKFPSLRRVLRDPERWARLVVFAAELNESLPAAPDAVALEGFLTRRRAAAPEKFADLSLSVIKLIGRGVYALDLPDGAASGHFALAVKDYTHSTAPNRRFPDLITQRLLKAALAGAPLPYTIAELTDLAKHCTDQEDAASKVERQVNKSAAALLLAGKMGQQFDAIVTGAADKGTWVRLIQPPTEGRLTLGTQGLNVGDHLRVKLIRTDVQRGFIDFARV